MNVFARDACASVGDFDFDAAIVSGGADFEHAAGGHGVTRIQKEVKKDLLKLVGGAAHGRERLAQLLDDMNLRSLKRVRDERKGFFDHAIDINVGKLGGASAREIQKIIDDFAGAEGLFNDFLDDGVTRIIVGHLLGKHLDVIGYDGERRIDFMSDAGSEKAQ